MCTKGQLQGHQAVLGLDHLVARMADDPAEQCSHIFLIIGDEDSGLATGSERQSFEAGHLLDVGCLDNGHLVSHIDRLQGILEWRQSGTLSP